jgi:F0F1-type ATP synthase membrane subunit b/b'
MKSPRRLLIPLLVLLVTVAPAADDGHGGHDAHPFNWTDFWGWVINSTLLFGGLIILLRKPLVKFLSQKSIDVKAGIVEREKQLEATLGQYQDIEGRIAKLEEEVSRISEAARGEGEAEKVRIEKAGRDESRRILDLTEAEISARVESSVVKLKERIADITIDHFKKEFAAGLDDETQKKIVDRNIAISGDILKREERRDEGRGDS